MSSTYSKHGMAWTAQELLGDSCCVAGWNGSQCIEKEIPEHAIGILKKVKAYKHSYNTSLWTFILIPTSISTPQHILQFQFHTQQGARIVMYCLKVKAMWKSLLLSIHKNTTPVVLYYVVLCCVVGQVDQRSFKSFKGWLIYTVTALQR